MYGGSLKSAWKANRGVVQNALTFFRTQLTDMLREAVRRYRRRRLGIGNYQTWEYLTPDEILADTRCIFVASTGRCGTAMLTALLEHDVRNRVWHKPAAELGYPSTISYRDFHDQPDRIAELVFHARFDMISDAGLRGYRYVETNNRITFYLPGLLRLLPHAKVIHLIRDPFAFISSGVRRKYYQNSLGDLSRIRPRPGDAHSDDWAQWSPQVRCGWLWNETNQWIEDAVTELPANQLLRLRAEDLFHDPATARGVLDFCETEAPERLIRKLQHNPVNAQGGRGLQYSDFSEADRMLIRRLTPLRKKYGYSLPDE
ncbi:MAG: hypothetical protein D6761_06250 [Candidatus Dadabacteria bacterium]|nr:MAG: hypothetical protein D6761_06250 [Candidatus Dadabacteria bacterium]